MVKVFHAARQDVEIVWNQAQLIPHPIFDTQVAAMVCGFGESVSYVNLVKQITAPATSTRPRASPTGRGGRCRSSSSPTRWATSRTCATSIRGLKAELAKRRAERAGSTRRWRGSSIRATYEAHPEDAWRRLKLRVKNRKGLAVLIELAAWRERAAQAQDVPRNRILRDEALYDIASHAPTERVAALAAAHAERGLRASRRAPGRSSRW